MNENYSTYEQIDQFLKGNLKGNDLTDFQQKLDLDKEFSETVRAQKVVNEMVMTRHLTALKGKMQEDLKNKNFNSANKKWNYGAFLGMLLVASVAVWLLNGETTTIQVLAKENKPLVKDERKVNEPILKTPEKAQIQKAKPDVPKSSSDILKISKPGTAILEITKETANEPVLIDKLPEAKTANKTEIAPLFDCSIKKWSVNIETSPTCSLKREGYILIFDIEKLEYSIDNGQHFGRIKEYNSLAQGKYLLIAKDLNGCEYKTTAEVNSKICKTMDDIVFNPTLGNWKVMTKDNLETEVEVHDKSGRLVWKRNSNSDQPEWDGKNNQGQLVEIGMYGFRIQYSDGDSNEGYISVMY